MFSLTYVSSAVHPFSPRELRDLLEECNDNNRARGITGLLLCKDGNFMQFARRQRGGRACSAQVDLCGSAAWMDNYAA
jgi:hypothetical protein